MLLYSLLCFRLRLPLLGYTDKELPNHICGTVYTAQLFTNSAIPFSYSCKGVTLHSGLYSHPRPESRSWPIKFSCLTPWPHWKFGLDPWLFSINHTHRAPGEALTVSKLASTVSLTAWPASKFGLDRLSSLWPQSRVGVQSPMHSVTPL